MKYSIACIIFLFAISFGWTQTHVEFDKKNFPEEKNEYKEALKEYEAGKELFESGKFQYKNALKHLKAAHKFNPNHALLNYMIGRCIIGTIHKAESIKYFEKAYALNKNVANDILYELGYSHHINEDWDLAIEWYKKYEHYLAEQKSKKNADVINQKIAAFDKRIEECRFGKEFSAHPIRVFIDNVGSTINSEYPDYGVVITADNRTMYFTSRRPGSYGSHKETEKDIEKDRMQQDYYEDIYMSRRSKNNTWSTPVNIGKPINTNGHDATVSLDPDGQHMIFYNASSEDGGLYEATLEGIEWLKPEKLSKQINTKYHESSASYSLDKKRIYFVSNKPEGNLGSYDIMAEDGHYTHDIFYCDWDENKKRWGEAKNLGPTINTKYNERGVFMHSDGKTLYFSSEGHNSMGGYDIFKTVLQKDGTWSKPENLGYPVNGPDHDVFFTLVANGRTGYYASEHTEGFGKQDIYVITFLGPAKKTICSSEDQLLSNEINPVAEIVIEPEVAVTTAQTTILKGRVIDAVTLKPVVAEITLTDNIANRELVTLKSNSESGDFLVSLPSGKNYGIAVEAPNYLFHSENFVIPEGEGYREFYKEIKLKSIAVGKSIVLKNIFFDFDKATLRDESKPELSRLIALLNDVPTMRIEISGHTDNKGSDDYNQRLSESRAKSVVDYLVKNGINAKRLEYKGAGESKPIDTNDTDEGRQNNRRTEFKIISK